MPHAGVAANLGQRGDADRAGLAHAPEVVAHQVDDHHVLGPVLGRVLELGALGERASALDRGAADVAAAPLEEELGRQRHERAPGAAEERRPVSGQRAHGSGEQVERVALEAAVETEAQVGLEEIAGPDALAAGLDQGRVGAGRGRPGPVRGAIGLGALGCAREPSAQLGPAGLDRGLSVRGDERLEEPLPTRVAAEHVVVEGERTGGQRDRRRGRRIEALDGGAEAEAEPAEPAAADRAAAVAVGELRLLREQCEGILIRGGDPHGLGAEQRPAARPRADERERLLVTAQCEHGAGRGQAAIEGCAAQDGGHAGHTSARDLAGPAGADTLRPWRRSGPDRRRAR